MQQSSTPPVPSFLRESSPGRIASLWSTWSRQSMEGAARIGTWWRSRVGTMRRQADSDAADDAVLCPRHDRLQFVAIIVALHALLAALGTSIAALPMIIGGAGVAAMVVWIGWYWPDEA